MKLFTNISTLINTEREYHRELDGVRNSLLNGLLYTCTVLGLPAAIIGAFEAYSQGQHHFAAAYLILYSLVPVSIFFSRVIPYLIRAVIPLILIYLISIMVMIRIGLSGIGIELQIAFCAIVMMLYGIRPGLYSLILSVLSIATVGYLMSMGHIPVHPENILNSTSPAAWLTTIFTFLLIVILLFFASIMLQNRLYQYKRQENSHTDELRRSNEMLKQEIMERKKVENSLKESIEKYRLLVKHAPSGICEIDLTTGKFTFANDVICEYMGLSREEILKTKVIDLLSGTHAKVHMERMEMARQGNEPEDPAEYSMKTADGETREIIAYPRYFYENGKAVRGTYVVNDITEIKNVERQLIQSLEEKELLLKEIHHRVKNNMQVISSLLNLQSDYIHDERDRKMILNTQNRVKSMASVHETLYGSGNLASLNMGQFIESLVTEIMNSHDISSEDISVRIDVKDILFSIETAIPCVLMINELVANALEHAFTSKKGEIIISLHTGGDGIYTLQISDNGKGMPREYMDGDSPSLGLKLITALVRQIKGEITFESAGGTRVTINFKTHV